MFEFISSEKVVVHKCFSVGGWVTQTIPQFERSIKKRSKNEPSLLRYGPYFRNDQLFGKGQVL